VAVVTTVFKDRQDFLFKKRSIIGIRMTRLSDGGTGQQREKPHSRLQELEGETWHHVKKMGGSPVLRREFPGSYTGMHYQPERGTGVARTPDIAISSGIPHFPR
jgi:hypothetical protein